MKNLTIKEKKVMLQALELLNRFTKCEDLNKQYEAILSKLIRIVKTDDETESEIWL